MQYNTSHQQTAVNITHNFEHAPSFLNRISLGEYAITEFDDRSSSWDFHKNNNAWSTILSADSEKYFGRKDNDHNDEFVSCAVTLLVIWLILI